MSHLISAEKARERLQSHSALAIRALMKDPVSGEPETTDQLVIPRSVNVDLDGNGSDHSSALPHTLPDEAVLSALLGALGVNKTHEIIVYDTRGIFCAPRVWWMLKALGHQSVNLLDGGLPGWIQSGMTCTPSTHAFSECEYHASYQHGWFVSADDVIAAIPTETQIVDARSPGRFAGTAAEPRPGLRSGHIPGSFNLYYQDVLDNGYFKPVDALRELFAQAGIDLNKPIICTCGSGITACIIGMAALMLGAESVSVYDGSWSEWGSNSDYPVEKGA